LQELIPNGFGNKLGPWTVSQELLLQNLVDLVAKLDG
jgi:hypothetical protein